LSCEAETYRARRRLVVGETEADPSSGELVGDAAVRLRTGRLSSEGLDEDLHPFPETQLQVKECSASKCCRQQEYGHPQAACQLTGISTLMVMVLSS
jgi:hypothetical protein